MQNQLGKAEKARTGTRFIRRSHLWQRCKHGPRPRPPLKRWGKKGLRQQTNHRPSVNLQAHLRSRYKQGQRLRPRLQPRDKQRPRLSP